MNFTLKCIPELVLVRVLPLGQGGHWTPPDVQLSLEIFQIANFIISSKFCKEKFALKCITGLDTVGVLPLGQGECPQRSSGV